MQNAGAEDAGTGLNKSNIIQKISLSQAQEVADGQRESADVVLVEANPPVINSNGKLTPSIRLVTDCGGATNFRGQLVFTGEGQGADVPPTLFLMNPREPYNTSGRLHRISLGFC